MGEANTDKLTLILQRPTAFSFHMIVIVRFSIWKWEVGDAFVFLSRNFGVAPSLKANPRMNIVHVVRQFHPATGGFESVVLELASAQAAAGHRVRVVTLNRLFNTDRILPSRDIVAGAEVVRVSYFGSQRYPFAPSVIKFMNDADIVHVHAIDFFFDYLAWTKPLHRRKLVVSTHGGFFHTSYAARFKRLYFGLVTRASLFWYDGVVAVSAADRALFSKIRNGIVCIENGVNVSKYRGSAPATPLKTLLALGRLSSNKRLDRLIYFVAALRKHDANWKLLIAGRRWDVSVESMHALAAKLGVREALEIVVDPSDDEIRQLVRQCSVIASASEYEGFGLAAVEGMSAGLFPILSDIPPFRDLVTRTGVGMLVEFSNPEAAAKAFAKKWPEVETDYPDYRAGAIEAASMYDWPLVCRSYQRIYDDICDATKRTIFGVPIFCGEASQAVQVIDARFERSEASIVAFANAHTLNLAYQDKSFQAVLRNSIVFNDGIGVDIASLMLFGVAFPQNLNGTDFMPNYLQNTRHQFRIFLLGGRPGIAARAGLFFAKQFPQHDFVGCYSGYFNEDESANIAAMIKASRADVVLVAMGNPLQEKWLAKNLASTGARLGFGVGALFDFVTGKASRAPAWVRFLRVEWFHRLLHDPLRLAGRYLVGSPRFIFRIVGQRLSPVSLDGDSLKA
jgi:alpha-1,3-mannosyltransferase